jgi:hypothetical protein
MNLKFRTLHSPDIDETFQFKDRTYTVVGYYNGTKDHTELFTKAISEEPFCELFEYQQWLHIVDVNEWKFMHESTLTELDLVCRLFHGQ